MPRAFSLDLRWRAVWAHMVHNLTFSEIAEACCLSERTVRRYVDLFHQTRDIHPRVYIPGPKKLLGEYEQVVLLPIVLSRPGILLHELLSALEDKFGVTVSVPTICRTLKFMAVQDSPCIM